MSRESRAALVQRGPIELGGTGCFQCPRLVVAGAGGNPQPDITSVRWLLIGGYKMIKEKPNCAIINNKQ